MDWAAWLMPTKATPCVASSAWSKGDSRIGAEPWPGQGATLPQVREYHRIEECARDPKTLSRARWNSTSKTRRRDGCGIFENGSSGCVFRVIQEPLGGRGRKRACCHQGPHGPLR